MLLTAICHLVVFSEVLLKYPHLKILTDGARVGMPVWDVTIEEELLLLGTRSKALESTVGFV